VHGNVTSIFADADGPALDGALTLAAVLASLSSDVRVVVPPAKDAGVEERGSDA
jgi:hypothetical protein